MRDHVPNGQPGPRDGKEGAERERLEVGTRKPRNPLMYDRGGVDDARREARTRGTSSHRCKTRRQNQHVASRGGPESGEGNLAWGGGGRGGGGVGIVARMNPSRNSKGEAENVSWTASRTPEAALAAPIRIRIILKALYCACSFGFSL